MREFDYLQSYSYGSKLNKADDIFISSHIEDDKGNIFENLSHPLFNAVGVIPKTQNILSPTFKIYLRKVFNWGRDERKLGTLLHINGKGSYGTIALKSLKQKKISDNLPDIYTNVYDDYLLHLKEIYSIRMGIRDSQFLKLKEVSDKVKERSKIHFFTSTEIFQNTYNPNFTPKNLFPKLHSDNINYLKNNMNYDHEYFVADSLIDKHFDFRAGAISVRSENPSELLPIEILHNIKIPRPFYENGNYAGIAEVGRFSALNSPEESVNLVKMAAMELTRGSRRTHNIIKIYIEVDRARKRLFQRYGFKEFKNIGESDYYRSGTDYIMVANISDFLKKSLHD